jgi:hypothetical protein
VTYHLETWQRVLDFALLLVMSIGFGMVVVAIRGPQRGRWSKEQRQKLGTAGGGVFALGLAARLLAGEMLKPIARPPPPVALRAGEEKVTDRTFSSTAPPAVSIEAPDGYALSFAPDSRRLTLGTQNGTTLVIFSRQLDSSGTAQSVLATLRNELTARGIATTDFTDSIDGKPALGLLATDGASGVASFVVDRGANYVSVLQCRAPGDARTACRPALAQLKWLTPAR